MCHILPIRTDRPGVSFPLHLPWPLCQFSTPRFVNNAVHPGSKHPVTQERNQPCLHPPLRGPRSGCQSASIVYTCLSVCALLKEWRVLCILISAYKFPPPYSSVRSVRFDVRFLFLILLLDTCFCISFSLASCLSCSFHLICVFFFFFSNSTDGLMMNPW